MPKKPCSGCGQLLAVGSNSRPEPLCRECRQSRRELNPRLFVCVGCGETFTPKDRRQSRPHKYCSHACFLESNLSTLLGSARRTRAVPTAWTARTKRRYRERVTPGLTARQLRDLRDHYVVTGTECFYCLSPATTVDHVVPLSRGGTNYEGNLVPCCKPCNSSKCALLLSEWRFERPHGGTVTWREWMDVVPEIMPRPVKVEPERFRGEASRCVCCYAYFSPILRHRNPAHCGAVECRKEYDRRSVRDRYRMGHGIPTSIDWPTKQWIRANMSVAA